MGLGSAIDKSTVTPLKRRGDRKFLELEGTAKEKFSMASRIPERVAPQNVANAAAAAKKEKIQTQLKQEVGKHLQTIMEEAAKQHKLHQEHQAKAAGIATQIAKVDAAHAEVVAKYLHELGVIRTETQAAISGYDARIQLEMGAIGF